MITSDYYRGCIQDSLEFIDQHLGDKFTAADVAKAASFSEYHFHRLFPAFVGESIHRYVYRRRLERAAMLLKENPSVRLLDLAIEVGFETHSAFSRAFKQAFGVTPSQFKKSTRYLEGNLMRPNLVTNAADIIGLTPSIQSLPELHFAYSVAKGTSAGHFFSQHRPYAEFSDLIQHSGQELVGTVSAFPASPQSLNDLSVEVWYGGLFTEFTASQREHCFLPIEAGKWIVFDHKGAYEYLHQVWNQIYRTWLPNSSYLIRNTLPFEMYLNNPQEVTPAELLTQIWVPIE